MKRFFGWLLLVCACQGFALGQKKRAKRPAPPAPAKMPAPTPAPVAPLPAPAPEVVAPVAQEPQKPKPVIFGESEKPAAKLPSADEILARYFKADGTAAAKEKLKTRISTGSFEIVGTGISGSVAVYQKAPNLSYTEVELPQLGTFLQGYDGQFGWAKDPINGLRNLNGAELSQARVAAQFNPSDAQKLYGKVVVQSLEVVNNREVYALIATLEGGNVALYFDKETGLLSRSDADADGPGGTRLPLQSYYDDYRDLDGVKVPFALRVVNPTFTVEMKFLQVKHNVEVDDKKFQRPMR